ncbi:MAG: tRNA uridine-5-carboxymethylaminomethyl(34) synthesis enzyme MnmG [Desulfovibrionaceae bacterium]
MLIDCIVVGAGHAGIEAAAALAKVGYSTMLITNNIDRIGHLSCNPAIGGVGKGHIVKEIDALGGIIGKLADKAALQFRTLNLSKGPAVQATRAQIDRDIYLRVAREYLFSLPTLSIWNDMVTEILVEDNRIIGVKTQTDKEFFSQYVILTVGTFLEGKVHVGMTSYSAGRLGDPPSHGLSASLIKNGITLGRLKTGTPPRILHSSINFSILEKQYGDDEPKPFSFSTKNYSLEQMPCYITWTNEKTHAIIREGFTRSPMFSGKILGIGARYCPSIEDKVHRFPEKIRHQVFIEPEGREIPECYPNGISTSLPLDIQERFVRSIPGLEDAVIVRHGYAIEYDFANPMQLYPTLESKAIAKLFFAGQINGTSGYEEAAGQGLYAAMNVIAKLQNLPPVYISRDMGYIGVLIDDLVTKGTEEPYRMFTSRAEYRLLLRENNADIRLRPLGRSLKLIDDDDWQLFTEKQILLQELINILHNTPVTATKENHDFFLTTLQTSIPNKLFTLAEFLKRPEIFLRPLAFFSPTILNYPNDIIDEVETILKYQGYLKRQEELVERSQRLEYILLPENIEYSLVPSLTKESIEKLTKVLPKNLAMASRISGITPATIASLEIFLRKEKMIDDRKKYHKA